MKSTNFLKCAVLALLAIGQVPCLAATFNVNSNADIASPPAGTVTLRSAIAAANTAGGANVVYVPAGLGPYNLTLGALTTTNASNNILVVQGTGGSAVIDAGGLSGVFRLTGGTITLSNLTIQNGSAPSPNPGSNGICSGGGIFIGGSTTANVISSVVTNNQTPNASGGGICVTGTLNLSNSTVSNNDGSNGGGGIRVSIAATASIANSTVSNNRITAIGAAGGGIENQGTLTVTNSTISGNSTSNGSGSAVSQETDGSTALSNVTIAGNSGPGSAQLTSYGANISVASTIIADPVSGANCLAASGGTITSNGHNLDSANSCGFASAGDLINANPLLKPLQNNGGTTSTMALLAGSPAINAVPLASCNLSTDQRGVPRPQGAACDIGAYEVVLTACVAVPSGIVAWWPMDEIAGATSLQDIISGNDATLSASPVGAAQGPQPVAGEVGGAMHFPKFGNGFSGSRVSPQGDLANIGAADFTIDAWVQVPTAPANRLHYIVNKFDSTQNKGYALYVVSPGVAGSERLEFKWGDGTNVNTVQTSSSLTTGQWHHVAVTFARNVGGAALDIRLYVDGSQQGQQAANPPGLGSLVNFVFLEIGWQPGTIDEPITIDELEIFNRALLQSEIQSIVNARNAGKCKTMPLPTEPTNIGGTACFALQQPPGSPPFVSYKPSLARPLGETTSGNTYSWLFDLGAFAGPVDSYLLLQLPNAGLLFLEEQPTLQWSPTAVPLVPSTSGLVTFSPLFNVPYSALAGTGTYFGHVFVVPAGTNPATFSLATSPYYHWCFQRTF